MSDSAILEELFKVIESRKGADPKSSYTARLFAKGPAKIAQKVGEEAVETVIAGLTDDHRELVYESADLLYHLLVLWADKGVDPQDVYDELRQRRAAMATE